MKGKKSRKLNCLGIGLVFLLGLTIGAFYGFRTLMSRSVLRHLTPEQQAQVKPFFDTRFRLPHEWTEVKPFSAELIAAAQGLQDDWSEQANRFWENQAGIGSGTDTVDLSFIHTGKEPSPEQWQQIEKTLEEYQGFLNAVEKLASIPGYEYNAFPRDNSKSGRPDNILSSAACDLLILKSRLFMHQQRWQESFDTLQLAYNLFAYHPASTMTTQEMSFIYHTKILKGIVRLVSQCDDLAILQAIYQNLQKSRTEMVAGGSLPPLLIDSVGILRDIKRKGGDVDINTDNPADLIRQIHADTMRIRSEQDGEESLRPATSFLHFIADDNIFYYVVRTMDHPDYELKREVCGAMLDLALLSVMQKIQRLPGAKDLEVSRFRIANIKDPFTSRPYRYDTSWNRHYSVGPDRKGDNALILYDPTNGIASAGDLFYIK